LLKKQEVVPFASQIKKVRKEASTEAFLNLRNLRNLRMVADGKALAHLTHKLQHL